MTTDSFDKAAVLAMIREAASEASEDGWKGPNSKAVSAAVLSYAEEFLDLLPDDIPAPEIAAVSEGEIEFEWYVGPDDNFCVSVGDGGRLSYAGRYSDKCGIARSSGTEWLPHREPYRKHLGVYRLRMMILTTMHRLIAEKECKT
jgi:hypothetical protein